MSWMVPKLKHRIQIRQPVQTPNDAGGYTRSYTTALTVWAEIKPVSVMGAYVAYTRGESVDTLPSHECTVRLTAVKSLGKSYTSGFSTGFDSIEDLAPLKNDYFIFLEAGSATKGRLFRIVDLKRDEENSEFLKFRVQEIEEQGTGFPT